MTVKVLSQPRAREESDSFQSESRTFFSLLADRTRFQIFDLLLTGRHCNCEIARELNISLSLVSHHLKKLVESGLVSANRDKTDARWIYFSINHTALTKFQQAFLDWTDPQRYKMRESLCQKTIDKKHSHT